jgi:hypothetical protein
MKSENTLRALSNTGVAILLYNTGALWMVACITTIKKKTGFNVIYVKKYVSSFEDTSDKTSVAYSDICETTLCSVCITTSLRSLDRVHTRSNETIQRGLILRSSAGL